MPLTSLQKSVLLFLAANRNPDSHIGGGAVINRAGDSPRYSSDLDLFHDIALSVATCAEADRAVLISQGFEVEWLVRQPSLYRASIRQGSESLGLDWCFDSAFRFFPVEPDPEFGFCLHRSDLATNKVLALAGRSAIRDYLDILYLHQTYLSLGAICWAACGKDEGFTPWSLLEMAKRNVKYREEDLQKEHLNQPVQLKDLKETWINAVMQAEEWFSNLPATDIGCLYLDATNAPHTPDPSGPDFRLVRCHRGSIRGAWPRPV